MNMEPPALPTSYFEWLEDVKQNIRSMQAKASRQVNTSLLALYREMGKQIVEKQERENWGNAIVDRLAGDLRREFPGTSGFSRSNLFYMRQLYLFYRDAPEFVQQAAGQIPWWHNVLIFTHAQSIAEATFYIHKTIENNWSRNLLNIQIESGLFRRLGKSVNNFDFTLPEPNAALAQETLKDPYIFDFLTLSEDMRELELERQLTTHITQFLLELGAGFAFVGRQYPIEVGEKTYYLDLLFYHIRLRSFIIIDLKLDAFKPEYAGKMNFYLSAVDDVLKSGQDQPSIGLILCKSKSRIEAEYALRNLKSPIGVSDFLFTASLPDDFDQQLPSVAFIEKEIETRLAKHSPDKNTNTGQ